MDFPRSVLVTGATGQQGGALARHLRDRGYRVIAFIRQPDSPAARALEELGIELALGDFEDVSSLEDAARRADTLFAMGTPFQAGPDAEVRQGMNLVDAARRAGVRHFIYSSVAGADRLTGIPHFDSKHEVERYLRRSNLPYTIVGPTFFMENFTGPTFREGLEHGMLAMGLPPTRGLQMVAVEDLARFFGRVIATPEDFFGERIDVASDEVTGHQASDLLSYVSGHRVHYQQVPLSILGEQSDDLAQMFEWLDRVGYHADVLTLRHEYPEVGWRTFEEWARLRDWSFVGSATRVETELGAH
ncbi:NmrA/HSCARG family protein [Hyalangium sp.]|uniref:NmrA/HSCARG family protein n=1 Tax=Hyalangium sp. TaxID=2028555 RepID=UPI002D4B60E2|nr:NmrA/HSCARG family protein [Hyalangium sp.]HYH96477.1 NmrA/HSCARG family protein [Hyalangium sp.]